MSLSESKFSRKKNSISSESESNSESAFTNQKVKKNLTQKQSINSFESSNDSYDSSESLMNKPSVIKKKNTQKQNKYPSESKKSNDSYLSNSDSYSDGEQYLKSVSRNSSNSFNSVNSSDSANNTDSDYDNISESMQSENSTKKKVKSKQKKNSKKKQTISFGQLSFNRNENLSNMASANDILTRVTQDYINCSQLSSDYKKKHRELMEMYMTLSKLLVIWQRQGTSTTDMSTKLLQLIKDSDILPAEEIDAYRRTQDQIMRDFYKANSKIDKVFFTKENPIFKDLTDEEKEEVLNDKKI